MAARAVLRHVEHTIRRHPDHETTAGAVCLRPDCHWETTPGLPVADCDRECMEHTGRMGHAMFQRMFTDVACVVLADTAEQERRTASNQLEYVHQGGAAEDQEETLGPMPPAGPSQTLTGE